MNKVIILLIPIFLSACSTTKLAPQAYMPAPPEILMKPPKELNTIRVEEEPKKKDE